jgi:magnesium-protoporphyrin IX monomethyl ester (oxidative) cyclase
MGEGEFAFFDLINALRNSRSIKIPGVITKADMQNARFFTPKHPIEDLDSLPFLKYDLLPLQKYWSGESRWVNMIATRGCQFNCNFCSIHSVMGKALRLRSIDNIISEIELIKERFNVNEIRFEDDGLTNNISWSKQLFSKIISKDFGITFKVRNGMRADTADEELLMLMKTAGFKEVIFSPESGSQKTLDNIIKKGLRLEKVEQAIVLAKI